MPQIGRVVAGRQIGRIPASRLHGAVVARCQCGRPVAALPVEADVGLDAISAEVTCVVNPIRSRRALDLVVVDIGGFGADAELAKSRCRHLVVQADVDAFSQQLAQVRVTARQAADHTGDRITLELVAERLHAGRIALAQDITRRHRSDAVVDADPVPVERCGQARHGRGAEHQPQGLGRGSFRCQGRIACTGHEGHRALATTRGDRHAGRTQLTVGHWHAGSGTTSLDRCVPGSSAIDAVAWVEVRVIRLRTAAEGVTQCRCAKAFGISAPGQHILDRFPHEAGFAVGRLAEVAVVRSTRGQIDTQQFGETLGFQQRHVQLGISLLDRVFTDRRIGCQIGREPRLLELPWHVKAADVALLEARSQTDSTGWQLEQLTRDVGCQALHRAAITALAGRHHIVECRLVRCRRAANDVKRRAFSQRDRRRCGAALDDAIGVHERRTDSLFQVQQVQVAGADKSAADPAVVDPGTPVPRHAADRQIAV